MCENGHPTESNLQIQFNPKENANSTFQSNKFMQKHNSSWIIKAILSKNKHNDRCFLLFYNKSYYRATIIKTEWHSHTHKHMHAHIHTHVSTHMHTHAYMHVHTKAHTGTHSHTHAHQLEDTRGPRFKTM